MIDNNKFPSVENALHALRPDSLWSVEYDSQNNWKINWHDLEQEKPTDEEIKDKIEEFKKEWDSFSYYLNRKKEYPDIAEQLDMIYWDSINGTQNWIDKISKIKDQYPKPEES